MKSHRLLALAVTALFLTALRAADAPPSAYPLTICIVSDEKLGEMGKPVLVDYKGRQIGFCCESCVKKFQNDPARYLSKLPSKSK